MTLLDPNESKSILGITIYYFAATSVRCITCCVVGVATCHSNPALHIVLYYGMPFGLGDYCSSGSLSICGVSHINLVPTCSYTIKCKVAAHVLQAITHCSRVCCWRHRCSKNSSSGFSAVLVVPRRYEPVALICSLL